MTQKHQLARTLSGHINMIALGGTIGTGLFLGAVAQFKRPAQLFFIGLYHYWFLRFAMMRRLANYYCLTMIRPLYWLHQKISRATRWLRDGVDLLIVGSLLQWLS